MIKREDFIEFNLCQLNQVTKNLVSFYKFNIETESGQNIVTDQI